MPAPISWPVSEMEILLKERFTTRVMDTTIPERPELAELFFSFQRELNEEARARKREKLESATD